MFAVDTHWMIIPQIKTSGRQSFGAFNFFFRQHFSFQEKNSTAVIIVYYFFTETFYGQVIMENSWMDGLILFNISPCVWGMYRQNSVNLQKAQWPVWLVTWPQPISERAWRNSGWNSHDMDLGKQWRFSQHATTESRGEESVKEQGILKWATFAPLG